MPNTEYSQSPRNVIEMFTSRHRAGYTSIQDPPSPADRNNNGTQPRLLHSETERQGMHRAVSRQARLEAPPDPDGPQRNGLRRSQKAQTERWLGLGRSHLHDPPGDGVERALRERRQSSVGQQDWDEHPQPHAEQDLELDPDYDTSPEHLLKLFNILDREQRGVITYEQLRMGLANLGTYSSLSYTVQRLGDELTGGEQHPIGYSAAAAGGGGVGASSNGAASAAGAGNSGHGHGEGITPQRFIQAVQEHAAKLYSVPDDEDGNSTSCFVYDYGPEALTCRWVERKEVSAETGNLKSPGLGTVTLEQLLVEPREPPQAVRWISITGVEPGMVIRLCNKFGIHPLMIEDCLNPSKERLKVDSHTEGRTHVLLAKISLHAPCQEWPSHLQKEQVSVFLVDNNTVILIERSRSDLNNVLANRIMYRGSKLRLNNAKYLVYSIVDGFVDQVFPIMQHYHDLLVELQGQVHADTKTPLAVVKAIQQVNRDNHMLQFYLRPMKPVVAQLAQELPGADDKELRRHLQDLYDHVVVLEELALRMVTWSQSLNEDYMNEAQHRMNQVMYVLTMVTTAFLPAQFLTGVFGMNFEYMPELQWKYSYVMFWALVSGLAFFVFNFYRRLKWL